MGAQFDVLVVDDGDLDDVRDLLLELGVEFAHLRGGAVPDQIDPPRDLFVTTARHAKLTTHWSATDDGRPVRIAVVAGDSTTLRSMLRRAGFSFLVRRPVHRAALRLLLLRALYHGDERRAEPRVPVGYEVKVRSRLRKRDALIVDLSSRGCCLLTEEPIAEKARIKVRVPTADGDDEITIAGRALRCEPAHDTPGAHQVAVRFEGLSDRERTLLGEAVAALAVGDALEDDGPDGATIGVDALQAARVAPAPPEGSQRRRAEDGKERRRHRRGHYEQRIVAAASEAMHRVLIGRDLSSGGMRVAPHPDLLVGERLRIAVYDPLREKPLVVQAVVARDDGAGGLALIFDEVGPEAARMLEQLVANLPPVECLSDGETGALGTVLSEIVS
ncbi:MAG: PilZ domain-containing protein [Myxococcota bacterium]|nr:PilZ domain-containing protein [Myxococcota bacterium]